MRLLPFPQCCSAMIATGFYSYPKSGTIEDLKKYTGTMARTSLNLGIITPSQHAALWPTLEKLGWEILHKGLSIHQPTYPVYLINYDGIRLEQAKGVENELPISF